MPQLTQRSGSTRATESERRLVRSSIVIAPYGQSIEHWTHPTQRSSSTTDGAGTASPRRAVNQGTASSPYPEARRDEQRLRAAQGLRERHPEGEEKVGRDARGQHERVSCGAIVSGQTMAVAVRAAMTGHITGRGGSTCGRDSRLT